MTTLVKRPNQLSLKNIKFSEMRKQQKGGSIVFINYEDPTTKKSHPLIVQMPKLFAPFGASYFQKEMTSTDLPKYNISLSLDEKVKGVTDLKTFLNNLDTMIKQKALKNKDWKSQLPKKLNETLIEAFYTPTIKPASDEKYPDSLNTKIPINWKIKQPGIELFNKQREELEVTFDNIEQLLPKLSEIKGLVQISHIWFVSKKFGVTLKIKQAMTYPKEVLKGFALLDDSDDEEEEEIVEKLEKTHLEDSDDDVEELEIVLEDE